MTDKISKNLKRQPSTRLVALMFVVIMILSAFTMLNFGTQAAFAPSPTSENQSFAHPMTVYYHAYFVESGLPSGTSWSVTYNSVVYSSTTTTIEITLTTSGTYSYSIPFADSGSYSYPPYPSSGTLSDTGTLDVGFGANTSAKETTTDANLKDWFYSTLADTTVLSQDYGIALWINGANVTTGTTNASNDYTAAFSHVFSTSGTDSAYFVWYAITGGLPSSPYDFATPTITVTINSDPTVTVSASQTTVDVGQLFTLSSSVSSGTSPYTYQWYSGTAAISGATSSSYSTSESTSGSYTFYVNVTDSVGYEVKSNVLTITVNPALTVSITASASTIDVGMQVNFTANPSGGSGTYTAYQWYLNNSAVSGATGSTWDTTSLPTGSPSITVSVTDSNLNTVTSSAYTETVNPKLQVSFSSSVNPSDYGEAVTFNSIVTGGTPPYFYQWSAMGANVSGATGATWTTSTLPIGNDPIRLWVRDSAGDPAPGKSNTAIPKIVMFATPFFSGRGNYVPDTVYVGDDFNVSVIQIGASSFDGLGYNAWLSNYSFSWYLNGSLIPGATKPYYATFEIHPGVYTFSVRITNLTDASGVYQGTWLGNWSETVLPNVLPPDSVEFIEQGLPNGTFWSANIIYPFGNGFSSISGMDGYYTLVRGNSVPTVILTPGSGTWHYEIADYVKNSNGMLTTPGGFVPNITQGNVTLPTNSANGSVIIYISFTSIGNTQPSSTSSVTHTPPLNTILTFSTVKDFALQHKILPIALKDPTVPPIITKTNASQISSPTFSVVSFIFLSLAAICLILSALGIQRFKRKKQRYRGGQD